MHQNQENQKNTMKNIQIAVACHKPSVLPTNALLMPVQVGSAIAARRMEGMRYDDEGENISAKNPQYCELTAQYWIWKNVEADYYGLCHYRRFLCFRDVDAPRNLRGQIESAAITPFTLARFGLEDEAEMRAVIEENDIVCGPLQDVVKLYTPRGNQPTALRHWTAHDRALIMTEDLERMLAILEEVSPEVGAAAREYLNGKQFLGFNCFVMRAELFRQMCATEFAVLEKLEKEVDLTHYNQQLTRIYGFMGEIICSSYIYWIEKSGKYRVRHLPLVYFNYTDPVPSPAPVAGEKTIPVFFDFSQEESFLLAAPLRSFLEHTEPGYRYDLIVALRRQEAYVQSAFAELCAPNENVSIRFLDASLLESVLTEEHGAVPGLLPCLPWILPEYRRMLVYGPKVLFAGSIVPLWEAHRETRALVCAPKDILMLARINDIYPETEWNYVSAQLKDPYGYFYTDSMLWNLEATRERFGIDEIKAAAINTLGQPRSGKELLNVLCGGSVEYIGQEYNVWYPTDGGLQYQLPYAPCGDYLALLKAQKAPVVIAYQFDTPWFDFGNPVSARFWAAARQTVFYEQMLAYMHERKNSVAREDRDILNKLFPRGKSMRGILSRLFPKGSRRNTFVKKLLHLFHMR